MTDTQSTPGHGQGGGQLPPITDPYVTDAGDTLQSIAERAGFSGQWGALALANIGQVDDPDGTMSDESKMAVVNDRSQFAGVSLMMPAEWNIGSQTKPATKREQDQDQERPAGDPKAIREALEDLESEHKRRR